MSPLAKHYGGGCCLRLWHLQKFSLRLGQDLSCDLPLSYFYLSLPGSDLERF